MVSAPVSFDEPSKTRGLFAVVSDPLVPLSGTDTQRPVRVVTANGGCRRRPHARCSRAERLAVSMSYGVLSTYPPTQCGLATFSKALLDSLSSANDLVRVVSVVDTPEACPPPEVSHQWQRGQPGGSIAA